MEEQKSLEGEEVRVTFRLLSLAGLSELLLLFQLLILPHVLLLEDYNALMRNLEAKTLNPDLRPHSVHPIVFLFLILRQKRTEKRSE
jgi:hypothetical protein